jgi:hypothetical protein
MREMSREEVRAVTSGASVFMTGFLQYLSVDVLKLSGRLAAVEGERMLMSRHLAMAVRSEAELSEILTNATFRAAGVVPLLHQWMRGEERWVGGGEEARGEREGAVVGGTWHGGECCGSGSAVAGMIRKESEGDIAGAEAGGSGLSRARLMLNRLLVREAAAGRLDRAVRQDSGPPAGSEEPAAELATQPEAEVREKSVAMMEMERRIRREEARWGPAPRGASESTGVLLASRVMGRRAGRRGASGGDRRRVVPRRSLGEYEPEKDMERWDRRMERWRELPVRCARSYSGE